MSTTNAVAGGGMDAEEIAKFDADAARWWDPDGPFAPLHRMQAARLSFLRDQCALHFARDPRRPGVLAGLDAVDVGCGGGLIAEPLARLGAQVRGVDGSAGAVAAARAHAESMGLSIDYACADASELPEASADLVVAFEVIEHTPDPARFVADCARLLRPGGLFALSTLNRTAASWLGAVVAAEYVLGWLPRGTHSWRRFVAPEEAAAHARDAGLAPFGQAGFVFDPARGGFRVSPRDVSINYAMTAVRPPA